MIQHGQTPPPGAQLVLLGRVRRGLLAFALPLALAACAEGEPTTWAMRPITQDYVFPSRNAEGTVIAEGRVVSALDLDEGRMSYVNFCASCHGLDGDGRGPASAGLDPAPRDFRKPVFKFAAVRSGELPSDADLHRLVSQGLEGTSMPAFRLDPRDLERLAHFLKTFPPPDCAPGEAECAPEGPKASPWVAVHTSGARKGRLKRSVGAVLSPPRDPWTGRSREATQAGELIYHLVAQCSTCHPSYLTQQALSERVRKAEGRDAPSMRDKPHESLVLEADKHPFGGELVPPDFTTSALRSIRRGHEQEDLYRVIAAGIGGVMPAWCDALSPEQIWAVTHYVESLTALRRPENGAARAALRRELGLADVGGNTPPPLPQR